MSSSPINERSPFSVTKSVSAKGDPTQATTTTKKKKYAVLAAVILSSVGLSGFAVAQYNTSSSGGWGDNVGGGSGGIGGSGGGIRASTVDTVEGLLLSSSVDLRSGCDSTCIPATGTWGGKSIQSGDSPFETCYQNEHTKEECWSKSWYLFCIWSECYPPNENWHYINSGAATSTCGSPCQQFADSIKELEPANC